jgi:hypothetical protein
VPNCFPECNDIRKQYLLHYIWILRIMEYMHLKRVCINNFIINSKSIFIRLVSSSRIISIINWLCISSWLCIRN